jgi:hypothetical protein
MPRSERCRIRGNCLHGIALPSRAQAPVADRAPGAGRGSCLGRPPAAGRAPAGGRAPGAGRAVPASGGSSGRSEGLSPSGDRRAVESRQQGSENRSEGMGERQGPSWKTIGGRAARAGRASQARLTEAAGFGFGGAILRAWSWRASGLLATGMGEAAHIAAVHPHRGEVKSTHRIEPRLCREGMG